MSTDRRSRSEEIFDQRERRRVAHVVSLRLECEAPDRDPHSGEVIAECIAQLLAEAELLRARSLPRPLQHLELHSHFRAVRTSAFTSLGKHDPP